MTTQRWTDEMLDQLAGVTQEMARVAQQNTDDISRLADATQQNTDDISRLADATQQNTGDISRLADAARQITALAELHQRQFDLVIAQLQEIQAEVRGLQTENRRILDQLINRNGEES
jgi:methyl-accepting chemotaxis protein